MPIPPSDESGTADSFQMAPLGLPDTNLCGPSPDACLRLQLDGTICEFFFISDRFAAVSKSSGQPFHKLLAQPGCHQFQVALETLRQTHATQNCHAIHMNQESQVVFSARLTPTLDNSILLFLFDLSKIDAQIPSWLNTARLQAIVEHATFGIVVSSCARGRPILGLNRRFAEMIGVGRKQISGKSLTAFLHPEDMPKDEHTFRDLISGEISSYIIEQRLLQHDHKSLAARLTVTLVPAYNEATPHQLTIVEDISHQRSTEGHLLGEQDLLRRLLTLQDREHTLIACDIHDGLIQDLVGAHMMVQTLCDKQRAQDKDIDRELIKADEFMSNALSEGRRLINELRPMILDELGLIDAIQSLVDREQSNGMEINFQHRFTDTDLSPSLTGNIFRIICEAITNAKRHGKATHTELRLTQVEKRLILIEVHDNGTGFDPQAVPVDRFGLAGIQERARLFGGGATIESSSAAGTRISVKLPLEHPEVTLKPLPTNIQWTI